MKQASAVSSINFRILIAFVLYILVPKLALALGLRMQNPNPVLYLGSVIQGIMDKRYSSKSDSPRKANDMLQVLMDYR